MAATITKPEIRDNKFANRHGAAKSDFLAYSKPIADANAVEIARSHGTVAYPSHFFGWTADGLRFIEVREINGNLDAEVARLGTHAERCENKDFDAITHPGNRGPGWEEYPARDAAAIREWLADSSEIIATYLYAPSRYLPAKIASELLAERTRVYAEYGVVG